MSEFIFLLLLGQSLLQLMSASNIIAIAFYNFNVIVHLLILKTVNDSCIELVMNIFNVLLQLSLSVLVLLSHLVIKFIKFTVNLLLLHVEVRAGPCERHSSMARHLVTCV